MCVYCARQSERIEQRHVGPLPELWAGRSPGITDMRKPGGVGLAGSEVVVLSKCELADACDGFEQRYGLRPEMGDLGFPGVDPSCFPCGHLIALEAPEERRQG